VTLGEDKAVPVLPIRVGWVQTHDFKVEGCDDIGNREAGAGMPVLGPIDHLNHIAAKGQRDFL